MKCLLPTWHLLCISIRPLPQREKDRSPASLSSSAGLPPRLGTLYAGRTSLRPGLRGFLEGPVPCLVEEETEGQGGAVTRPMAQPGQQRQLSLGLLGFWPHRPSCPTAHSGSEKLPRLKDRTEVLSPNEASTLVYMVPTPRQPHTWPPSYITAPNPHSCLLRRRHVSILQMRKPRVRVAQQPD